MDKISWIDANGMETSLSKEINYKVLNGMQGRFMPTLSFSEDEVPFHAGSRLRDIKVKSRDIDIPLLIKADSEIDLRNKIRACLRIFNPLKGDGKIRVTAPDGSQRELFCRYAAGLEGKEDRGSKGLTWMTFILVFRAFDPYWYDSSTIVQTFNTGQPATFFPFFPLRLSSSTVFADISVNNDGDVETWPEWIITGPGSGPVFRNLTTGEVMNLNATLQENESITIDTRPGNKTIKKDDGTNLFATLSDDSSLWPLESGNNNVRIEFSDVNTVSSVQLSYRNRYWGP